MNSQYLPGIFIFTTLATFQVKVSCVNWPSMQKEAIPNNMLLICNIFVLVTNLERLIYFAYAKEFLPSHCII